LALAAVGTLTLSPPAGAQDSVPMDYGVSIVSDYVFRGIDLYSGVYTKNEEEEAVFNVAPAVQPSVTFYSDSGFSFAFWGSWALTERDEDEDTGFGGLKTLDELDSTFAYDWSNGLGSFTAGIVNYALIHPSSQGEDGANIQEMFFSWGLPVMESLGPSLSYYVDSANANTYTAVAVGGGDALYWGANVGYGSVGGSQGVQDITASIGYDIGGGMSVDVYGVYRPTPQLVGYDSDGKYISAKDGSEADYPPAIFWLSFNYGGEVTAE
jgi:hypothetical protein